MKTFRKPYKDVMSLERFEKHARLWMAAIHSHPDDEEFHRDIANVIRNFIFDVGLRSTGYVSREAISLKPSARCKEHFHSRLAVGQSIVRKIKSGRYRFNQDSVRRMYLEVFSACRVHSCTREENQRLAVIQNDPATKHLPWRKQYKLAGVYLVYTGSVYVWEGCRYVGWTEHDMASMLGVSIYKFRRYIAPEAMQ